MLQIPILRKGSPYFSLDRACVPHHRTREPFVEISQANTGLIRRDLLEQKTARDKLAKFSTEELIALCARAAEHFMSDALPLGDESQTPGAYVEQVSATTGLPHVMVQRNMEKINGVMAAIGEVLRGLTRNLELRVLDMGMGAIDGHSLSFYPRAQSLGVVLPNNSPGVHSLWVPAIPLKMPLVLKPGSAEPWTPFRIAQAMIRAGVPHEAFSFYPTDHSGSGEILRTCGRGMIFGDASSIESWNTDGRVEVHGPGYSKIIIGDDCVDDWEQYVDVMVRSIVDNGGRSCVNASGIWISRHGEKIAEALASRLARIEPRNADDENAEIAPFTDFNVAVRINGIIEQGLTETGARDVTSSFRDTERLVSWNNCSYLLPTIVSCENSSHTLANREFLFPFASVVQINQSEMVKAIGPSLVVTAITSDDELIRELVSSPNVDRLNLGAVPTNQISWDQPHEGNLFEHLYARRAFQRASAAV